MTKKSVKKISIILGIVSIVLWFGGNLGLYVIAKHYTYKPSLQKLMDYVPEKLTIDESRIKNKAIPLMGVKLKLPYDKENIVNVNPFFLLHECTHIMIKVKNNEESLYIALDTTITNIKKDRQESWFNKALNKVLNIDSKPFDYKSIYYARLNDFSWWNLRHNIRLTVRLVLKALALPTSKLTSIYDVEIPYLNGILIEGEGKTANKANVFFSFTLNDKNYSINFINATKDDLIEIRDIISAIQVDDNIEKSYSEMESLYKNKEYSVYPEELILISMISLKGPTIEDLKELLKVMEDKDYHPSSIENVKKEIEYLEKQ